MLTITDIAKMNNLDEVFAHDFALNSSGRYTMIIVYGSDGRSVERISIATKHMPRFVMDVQDAYYFAKHAA